MSKQKKKKKKAKKAGATKVILMTGEETDEEDIDEEDEDDEEESGIHLEKEDVQLIYNALKNYKPTHKDDVLYETLLEQFEQMLVVEFGVKLPGFEFMDEEKD